MPLYFNTAGPCVPGEHYMLSPLKRFSHVIDLVERRKYFTVHAGRQTGKTTNSRWLVDQFNAGKQHCALWVDIETARDQPDIAKAMQSLLGVLERAVQRDLPLISALPDTKQLLGDPTSCLQQYLVHLCRIAPRPVVVFFDEADGLVGEAMVSFLTQLRAGYLDRSRTPFPHALALVGQRQVREYALHVEDQRTVSWLGTTSPFNVTAEAATLEPFTHGDVEELLLQHTTATGQIFRPDAVEQIWYLSQGHPWLVNALAAEAVDRDVMDRFQPVTAKYIEVGKERIIVERRTHIDSLVARLREPRVQRILAPMLVGERTGQDVLDDDMQYVIGLGLIVSRQGQFEIANPIYREVIPRALNYMQQMQIREQTAWYLTPDGALDMLKLFVSWQSFWRKDGHLAAEGFGYREAGPHLMLMAFLQRILNGGGRIEREYGLGRGALDLIIEWHGQQHAIEVKLRRDTETEAEACDQITRYIDRLGLNVGWLVIFDLRKEVTWDQKLTIRTIEHEGRRVQIVGC
jgi:type II secretory pathway predicted ATPase ExeA